MPVPIADTHAKGVGLEGHQVHQMESAGPFARLAATATSKETKESVSTVHEVVAMETEPATRGPEAERHEQPAIVVSGLKWSYPGIDGRPILGMPPLIESMSFKVDHGSRVLLLGANGAGKTTLLKILAGKHLIRPEDGLIRILDRAPFQDTMLTSSGDLSYIGGTWTRDVAFAGTAIPLTGDFPAGKMIDSVPGACPIRKQRLIEALDVDPSWRMHQVSDGQRRRVQLVVGLLRPFQVLLLDEVTVDLDVLGRRNLVQFLKEECEGPRKATVVYCTHIFEGLESWPTHVAYVARGEMRMMVEASKVPELSALSSQPSPSVGESAAGMGSKSAWEKGLLGLVCRLLLAEEAPDRSVRSSAPVEWDPSREGMVEGFSYVFNNGWVPGTLTSSLDMKGSTNTVMRN